MFISKVEAKEALFSFNEETDLPQAGDIAIGFDAVPLLNFGLNAINIGNNTGQNASGLLTYPNGTSQTLTAKYFINYNQAIRIQVGINRNSSSETVFYTNPIDEANPDVAQASEISDTVTSNNTVVVLSGGYEQRRGYDRIQGFYGGEALIGLSSLSSSTNYGWNYSDQAFDFGVIGDGSSRVTQSASGRGLTVGLRGLVGVEYFIAPKISIGSEYGFALTYSSQARGSSTIESWTVNDEGEGSRDMDTEETGSSASSYVGHDNGIDQFL